MRTERFALTYVRKPQGVPMPPLSDGNLQKTRRQFVACPAFGIRRAFSRRGTCFCVARPGRALGFHRIQPLGIFQRQFARKTTGFA
jgi:hypothetical protein